MSHILPLVFPTASPVIPPEIPRKPEPKKPGVCLVRDEAVIPLHRLHHLEVTRRRLQLTDPDRHDLDADSAFASLAPGYAAAVEWSDRYVAEHGVSA